MKPIYLCGPGKVLCQEDLHWRDRVKAMLDTMQFLEPTMRSFPGRGMETGVAEESAEKAMTAIKKCDCIIVMLDAESLGPSMEVMWAWMNRIRVRSVNPKNERISPWLILHSTSIHSCPEEAVSAELSQINQHGCDSRESVKTSPSEARILI
jgi:hypothetical protein